MRNLPPAEVAAATAGNFRRFFGLAADGEPGFTARDVTEEGYLTADG